MIPLGAVAPKIGVVEWTTEEMERAIDWLGGWEQAPPITSSFMLSFGLSPLVPGLIPQPILHVA
jgi:hypothetical protein